MKTSRIAVALLLALAPCAVTTPSFAQSGAEDPTTAMARARFKEGVDFYDKGEYDQARASFLQAYALKKHPAVLLNLAWSWLKSGHAAEGKKYLEQFLAEGKDITDKQRADANDGLTQAKAKLGRIEIQAAAGTDITVDGEHVGTAPLTDAISVEAGAHTLKFKGPDGSTDTQSVSVLGGQKAVAKFPQTGSAPTAVPAPVPTAPPSPAPSPAPSDTSLPSDQTPKPPDTTAKDTTAKPAGNLLAPPNNVVPAVILAGVGGVGLGVGIIFGVIKGNAQNNANSVAVQIQANGGGQGTCNAPSAKFANACNAYSSDLNDVNTDATIANIGIGVGVAGLVGAALYWVLANKDSSSSTGQITAPTVLPTIGHSSGGLSLTGSF
jgi:hypothetical protein